MDILEINTNAWKWISVDKADIIGGKTYTINFSFELQDLLTWVEEHKRQLDLEDKARREHESVRSAYEQYLMTLKLATNG